MHVRHQLPTRQWTSSIEEALERERDFSRAILESAQGLIVVMDVEGRILVFNRGCEELTGFREEEVRGRPVWEMLVPPREIPERLARFARLREGRITGRFEAHWLTRTGEERLISWRTAILRSGQEDVIGVIGNGMDVTDYRRGEQTLAQEQERLLQSEGRLRERNLELEFLFGFARELTSLLTRDDLARFLDEAAGRIAALLPEAACSLFVSETREQLRVAHCGGPAPRATAGWTAGMASRDLWRWMAGPQCRAWQDCRDPDLPLPPLLGSFCNDFAIGALAVAPFSRGAGGAGSEPLGLVTIHSPVPRPWDENKCRWLEAVADLVAHGFERASLLEDLNRYADDLESAKADLERRVAERTAQLVHMERAAMLGAVTAGVVHDIRNPLITLSGYHRLTRRCLDQLSAHLEGSSMGSSVAELEDRFRKAEQAALGVIDVVENMLGFARKETRIDTLDIPAVIREALRLLSSVLVGVRAEVRTPPAGVKSRGSHAHLLQVIMNLVANAGHAVKETPDPQVVIRCAADENLVTIRVEDNGPGVPEPLRSQLFRPFFTTKAGAGTGLGLMISRHIVEGMGGALSYQNSELGGACFVIRLPAAQEGAYHETP